MEIEQLIEYKIQNLREWYDILYKALSGDIENLQIDSCYLPILKNIKRKLEKLELLWEKFNIQRTLNNTQKTLDN